MKSNNLTQLDIPLRQEPDELDITLIRRQPTLNKAIGLCVSSAGFERDKPVYMELEIDPSHWTRIKNGDAHFPTDKLELLMDFCGNEAPLIWLADKRGYLLTPKESEMERKYREEKDRRVEAEQKLEHYIEFAKASK